MTGELAQEQRLGLWQGWGGQQGSGSLATLLQARGLCSRGGKEKKVQFRRLGHPPASQGSPVHKLWWVSTPCRALENPDLNLSPRSRDCFFAAHPFPQTGCGTCGYSRDTRAHRADALGLSDPSHWRLPAPFTPLTAPDQTVGQLQHIPPLSTAREGGREDGEPSCSPSRGGI